MSDAEHERIHEQAEREADDLERRNKQLDEHIKETRQDWEAKKSDEAIPGAVADDEEDSQPLPPEADITPGD
jgi:hypothetical protein